MNPSYGTWISTMFVYSLLLCLGMIAITLMAFTFTRPVAQGNPFL